jgi:hypothetical protein
MGYAQRCKATRGTPGGQPQLLPAEWPILGTALSVPQGPVWQPGEPLRAPGRGTVPGRPGSRIARAPQYGAWSHARMQEYLVGEWFPGISRGPAQRCGLRLACGLIWTTICCSLPSIPIHKGASPGPGSQLVSRVGGSPLPSAAARLVMPQATSRSGAVPCVAGRVSAGPRGSQSHTAGRRSGQRNHSSR